MAKHHANFNVIFFHSFKNLVNQLAINKSTVQEEIIHLGEINNQTCCCQARPGSQRKYCLIRRELIAASEPLIESYWIKSIAINIPRLVFSTFIRIRRKAFTILHNLHF